MSMAQSTRHERGSSAIDCAVDTLPIGRRAASVGPPGHAPPRVGPPGHAPPRVGPPGHAPPCVGPPGGVTIPAGPPGTVPTSIGCQRLSGQRPVRCRLPILGAVCRRLPAHRTMERRLPASSATCRRLSGGSRVNAPGSRRSRRARTAWGGRSRCIASERCRWAWPIGRARPCRRGRSRRRRCRW